MDRRSLLRLPPALPIVVGLAGLVPSAAAQRPAIRSVTVFATVMPAPSMGGPVQVLEFERARGTVRVGAREWARSGSTAFVKLPVGSPAPVARGRVRLTLVYL